MVTNGNNNNFGRVDSSLNEQQELLRTIYPLFEINFAIPTLVLGLLHMLRPHNRLKDINIIKTLTFSNNSKV